MRTRKLEDLLDRLSIPLDNYGYKYLISAIEIYEEDKSKKITAVYNQVAKKHNSTGSRVERAIRHSIESNEEKIKKYFNVDYDITNRRFLALMVREMERQNVRK